jgi:hypothetical protein
MDQVLHADDAELAEVVLDQLVVCKRNALLVDLAISTLVDELTDRLEVGVAIGDVWVDNGKHLLGGLGQANEDAVVDLEKSEELEDLSGLGGDFIDTLDTHDKDKLWLILNVEAAILLAQTSETNLLALSIPVLLDVCLGLLEDGPTLLLVRRFPLLLCRRAFFSGLLLALPLL